MAALISIAMVEIFNHSSQGQIKIYISFIIINYPFYSPTEVFFFLRPPKPLWKFQLSFIYFFKFFGVTEPPTPQEIPIPLVGGYFLELRNVILNYIIILFLQEFVKLTTKEKKPAMVMFYAPCKLNCLPKPCT